MRADETKPGAVAVVVVYAIWACDLVGVPLRYVRKGRGPRCDDLLTKLLAFALMPYLVLFLGGRPTPVANAVWLLLVVFCVGGHLTAGWRQAEGLHTRFIGLSVPEVAFGVSRDVALVVAEPALWAAVGLVVRACGEVGLANYLWAAAATGPVEYLVLAYRDRSLARDVRDARIEHEYRRAWFDDRPEDRL